MIATINTGRALSRTKIENLNVYFGKNRILKEINLDIKAGQLVAIIGQNGAGKSTLLKSILGEVVHEGTISFLDKNNSLIADPIVGYVPQKLDFDVSSPVSVIDVFSANLNRKPVCFSIRNNTRKKVKEILKLVNGEDLIDKKLGVLSGGELQRVLLALAIYPMPDILLLDEPVSGIDKNGIDMFMKMILELKNKYSLSIILITHDLKGIDNFADEVIFINNTTIEAKGTPKDVFNDRKVINVFGRVLNEEGM
ncbi:MAG: metal ABC transporter ATP-binding protein [Clostridiaceae bacterium]|nr:metal ABC transporter ATP-binding protein [Clostridiaceae bacterium]